MGDYTPPAAPTTCESIDSDVTVDAAADVPVAYGTNLDADVCLDIDLTDADEKLAAVQDKLDALDAASLE